MPEHDLIPTPGQTIGPFFHNALSYDGGAELVPPGSAGAIRFHGTVLDGAREPVPDALVEIRQADTEGDVPKVEGSLHRGGKTFTGWGRAATDRDGRYAFVTVEPDAPFIAIAVFARGLLNRLFTRAYLPGAEDAFLSSLSDERRSTLVAVRDPNSDLRFDIVLQGDAETVFLTYPRHRA
ncbi:MAG: protocatechuate 3,4-dioxygenase subunit alpha [Marmoricola sp.]